VWKSSGFEFAQYLLPSTVGCIGEKDFQGWLKASLDTNCTGKAVVDDRQELLSKVEGLIKEAVASH